MYIPNCSCSIQWDPRSVVISEPLKSFFKYSFIDYNRDCKTGHIHNLIIAINISMISYMQSLREDAFHFFLQYNKYTLARIELQLKIKPLAASEEIYQVNCGSVVVS